MTCGHCVASVTEEVSEVAGVEHVDAVLETGALARHQHRAQSTPTSRPPSRAAVEEAGYQGGHDHATVPWGPR